MKVLSLTEARNNIKEMFESVYVDNEEVILHRKGRESVIVISLSEYNSLKETTYLFESANNKKDLLESLKELRESKGLKKELLK